MSGHNSFLERDQLEPSVELDYEGSRRSHLPSPPASQTSPSTRRTGLAVLRFVPETISKEYPNGKRCAHFCCPMCDKVEDRKGNLEKHMVRAHRIQAHMLDSKESIAGPPKLTGRPRGRPPGSTKKNIAKARDAVEYAQRASYPSQQLHSRRGKRKGKFLIDAPFRFGEMIDLTRSPSPPVVAQQCTAPTLRNSEQPVAPELFGRAFELHDQWQREGVPSHAALVLNEALADEIRSRDESAQRRAVTTDKGKGRQPGNHSQEAEAPIWQTAPKTPPAVSGSNIDEVVVSAEAIAPASYVNPSLAVSETPPCAPTPAPSQHPFTPALEPVSQPSSPACPPPHSPSAAESSEDAQPIVTLERKRSSQSPDRSVLKDPNAGTKYVAAGLRQVSHDLAGAATCIFEHSQAMSQMLDGIEQAHRGARKIGSDLQGMSTLLNKLEVRFQDIASRFDTPEADDEMA